MESKRRGDALLRGHGGTIVQSEPAGPVSPVNRSGARSDVPGHGARRSTTRRGGHRLVPVPVWWPSVLARTPAMRWAANSGLHAWDEQRICLPSLLGTRLPVPKGDAEDSTPNGSETYRGANQYRPPPRSRAFKPPRMHWRTYQRLLAVLDRECPGALVRISGRIVCQRLGCAAVLA
jgi:hypothetical protein